MTSKPPAAQTAAQSPLAVRAGVAMPTAVMDFIATSSVTALTGRDRKQREARRSLAELTRIVGEVLHRVRAQPRHAAPMPAAPESGATPNREEG